MVTSNIIPSNGIGDHPPEPLKAVKDPAPERVVKEAVRQRREGVGLPFVRFVDGGVVAKELACMEMFVAENNGLS